MADADGDLNDEQWGGVEFNPDDEKATDLMWSIVENPRRRKVRISQIFCTTLIIPTKSFDEDDNDAGIGAAPPPNDIL
jgi:hypothetical protein